MRQAARSCELDFVTAFGNTPDTELLDELSKKLGQSDTLAIFKISYGWYHSSLVTDQAEEDFRKFEENGVAPFYVKRHLLWFREKTQ